MRGGKPSRARVAPHDHAVGKGGADPLTGCIASDPATLCMSSAQQFASHETWGY